MSSHFPQYIAWKAWYPVIPSDTPSSELCRLSRCFCNHHVDNKINSPLPTEKINAKMASTDKTHQIFKDKRLFLKTVEDKPNPVLFDAVIIMLKMANLDGQFHLDAKELRRIVEQPLSTSAQVCSEMVSIAIKGKIHPECGWHHSVDCAFRKKQGRWDRKPNSRCQLYFPWVPKLLLLLLFNRRCQSFQPFHSGTLQGASRLAVWNVSSLLSYFWCFRDWIATGYSGCLQHSHRCIVSIALSHKNRCTKLSLIIFIICYIPIDLPEPMEIGILQIT